jgi:hypothetical protein
MVELSCLLQELNNNIQSALDDCDSIDEAKETVNAIISNYLDENEDGN